MNSSGTNSHSEKELSDDKILRRDFTSNSIKTILSISLLEHLCATDLLANKDKYTAKKWLHAVHEIGRSVKETKISQTQWQKEVEELFQNKIELNEENFLNATQIGNQEIDIFIRTGGDKRLSNFLLANIGYTELFFSDKLWPEFSNNDFIQILDEFKERQRRFGK